MHFRGRAGVAVLPPRYGLSLLCLSLGLFLTPKPFTYSCFPKDPEITVYSPSVPDRRSVFFVLQFRTKHGWFCYLWGWAHTGARPASPDAHVGSHAHYAVPGWSCALGSWRWLTLSSPGELPKHARTRGPSQAHDGAWASVLFQSFPCDSVC